MHLSGNRAGLYGTACEKSPYKTDIDTWLNEGKSYKFISQELEKRGEKISDKSIGKYANIRKEQISKELMKDPIYQAQIQTANQTLVDEVSKFKQVNVINHIAEAIEHCAELTANARMADIQIRNIQDLRYVQTTMLEALKLYGDTALKIQQYQKIEENPDLLRPTANVHVKNILVDALGGVDDNVKFALVDKLRGSIGGTQSS